MTSFKTANELCSTTVHGCDNTIWRKHSENLQAIDKTTSDQITGPC